MLYPSRHADRVLNRSVILLKRPLLASRTWTWIVLWFTLVFPSLRVYDHAGVFGLMLYMSYCTIGLWACFTYLVPWADNHLSERAALGAALMGLLALMTLYAIVYPYASAGLIGGRGSDRDEALNMGVREILQGRYPYYEKTYVPGLPHERGVDGNYFTIFPGSLLFAAPFALIGNSTYQNFFWLIVAFLALSGLLKSQARALLLLGLGMALSPQILWEIVSGGDLIANSLWLLIMSTFLLLRSSDGPVFGSRYYLVAVALGVGLSCRAPFWLVTPILLGGMFRRAGPGATARLSAIGLLSFSAVTLPFYLYDPAHFTPLLETYARLTVYRKMLPGIDWIVPSFSLAFALFLSLLPAKDEVQAFVGRSAIVIALPFIFACILACWHAGISHFAAWSGYGVSFLYWGVLSAWLRLLPATKPCRAEIRPPGIDLLTDNNGITAT